MRRLFWGVVVLALIISGAVIAAPVQVWSPWGIEWNKNIQDLTDREFTKATGIEVKIVTIPSQGLESKYLLAAVSGEVPEIGITGSLGPADLGIRGAAVDLKERFGKAYDEIKIMMYPGLMRSFDYKGTHYGLPTDIALYPLGYRKDILDELGLSVPQTWQDLYAMLPKMQAKGKNFSTAFGFADGQFESIYADVSMFIWQHGGDWYTQDRAKSGLDTPEAIRGFIEFTELYTKRGIPKAVDGYMGFRSGELPLLQMSNWFYAATLMSAPEIKGKWAISVMPGTKQADGTINHAAYIGGMAFAMFKQGHRLDDAFLWMKWFLSKETQSKYANEIPKALPGNIVLPANIAALPNVPLPADDVKAYMKQAASSIAPAYALSPESVTHRFLKNACAKVVLHGGNPEQSIRDAAKEMDFELAKKQKEYARFISKQ